jgi:hypothetical protein
MSIITNQRKVTKRAAVGVAAILAAATLGAGGFYLGSQSSWVANSAYQNGYHQASDDFCNLKSSAGVDASKPYSDDIRVYEYVPENVLVADAVCTDDQVRSWNAAQADAGSPERACKLDLDIAYIVSALSAAECVAPESLN